MVGTRRTRALEPVQQASTTRALRSTRSTSRKVATQGESDKENTPPKELNKEQANAENATEKATQEICGICLDSVNIIKGSLPVCVHTFCFDCIHQWSKTSNTCPMCKATFRMISRAEVGKGRPKRVRVNDVDQRAEYSDPDPDDFLTDDEDSDDDQLFNYYDIFGAWLGGIIVSDEEDEDVEINEDEEEEDDDLEAEAVDEDEDEDEEDDEGLSWEQQIAEANALDRGIITIVDSDYDEDEDEDVEELEDDSDEVHTTMVTRSRARSNSRSRLPSTRSTRGSHIVDIDEIEDEDDGDDEGEDEENEEESEIGPRRSRRIRDTRREVVDLVESEDSECEEYESSDQEDQVIAPRMSLRAHLRTYGSVPRISAIPRPTRRVRQRATNNNNNNDNSNNNNVINNNNNLYEEPEEAERTPKRARRSPARFGFDYGTRSAPFTPTTTTTTTTTTSWTENLDYEDDDQVEEEAEEEVEEEETEETPRYNLRRRHSGHEKMEY